MPRLARFLADHPDFEVRLAAGMDYARFITDEFDADIIYGPPRGQGLIVVPLSSETVTPLCAPRFAAELREPADLLSRMLIQSDNKLVRWPHWFERNGLHAPAPARLRFDHSFLAIAAAVDVTYTGHQLVLPASTRRRLPLGMFARWLAKELDIGLPPEIA